MSATQRQSALTWSVQQWIAMIGSDSPEAKRYQEINLSNRQIDDTQCAALFGALSKNTTVRVLDLQGNFITSVGALSIAQCIRENTTLTEINLEMNPRFGNVDKIVEMLEFNNVLTSFRVDPMSIASPVVAASLAFKLQLNAQPLPFKAMLAALDKGDVQGSSTLDLTGCSAEQLSMQFLLESLLRNKNIRTVDLSDIGISDKGAETMGALLRRSKTIQTIRLANDGVGAHGVRDLSEGLRDNASITRLDLRNNKIADDSVRVLIDALKVNNTLLVCELQDNAVSQSSLEVLNRALFLNSQPRPLKIALHAALSNDKALTEINFNNNGPSMDQSASFLAPALKNNTSVKVLNLSTACIGDEGALDIAAMVKVNTTLEVLHLSNNKITISGGQALAVAIGHNTSLTDVNVANNDIQSEGAASFVRMLQINPNVIALNVELNDVSDELLQQIEWLLFINLQPKGLKRILPNIQNNDSRLTSINFSQYDGDRYYGDGSMLVLCRYLMHNYTVKELHLNNNNIGDMGAVHVADVLRDNRTITFVDFATNGVCDRGATALAEALRVNSTVTHLDLTSNCVGERGALAFVETFKDNHSLVFLGLKGNRVPASAINDVQIACAINTQPAALKDVIPRLRAKDNTLTELDFSHSGSKMFDDASVAIMCHELRENDSVTKVKLSNNCFESDGARALADLLVSNTRITILELANNTIGDVGLQYLSEMLKVNNTLRVLNVENNHIGDRGTEALIDALRAGNDTLQEVSITRGNDIATSLLSELADEIILNSQPIALKRLLPKLLANDATVTCLDLSNAGYDDQSCRSIAVALRRNTRVTSLNLNANRISSTGVVYLAEMLEDNVTLRELHLRGQLGSGIDNRGMRVMNECLTLTNHTLACFEVDGPQITEDLMLELQYALLFNNQPLALKKCVDRLAQYDPTLVSLDFSQNTFDGRHRMTDVSMRLLCAMLPTNTTVQEINLGDNTFTDTGFGCLCDILRTNNTLTSLNFENCPNLTPAAMRDLAIALKTNHGLAFVKLDRKKWFSTAFDALEAVEHAVRINSVPMPSSRVPKIPASAMKKNSRIPSLTQQTAMLSAARPPAATVETAVEGVATLE